MHRYRCTACLSLLLLWVCGALAVVPRLRKQLGLDAHSCLKQRLPSLEEVVWLACPPWQAWQLRQVLGRSLPACACLLRCARLAARALACRLCCWRRDRLVKVVQLGWVRVAALAVNALQAALGQTRVRNDKGGQDGIGVVRCV